jgi:hypothetical protein
MDEPTDGVTSESIQPPLDAGAGGASAKDDLKAALTSLTSALNKFGTAADAKAREEWKLAKPEIQKALAEMRRAVDAGTQKASSSIDSLSKRMSNKNDGAGEATQSETNPADPTTWNDGTPTS